jgi:hypothetical protein
MESEKHDGGGKTLIIKQNNLCSSFYKKCIRKAIHVVLTPGFVER